VADSSKICGLEQGATATPQPLRHMRALGNGVGSPLTRSGMRRHWSNGRKGRAEQMIEEMVDVEQQELRRVNGSCRLFLAPQ